MKFSEWKAEVRKVKDALGANPTSKNYNAQIDNDVTSALFGQGPMANHPEILRLLELEKEIESLRDFTGDLPDFDRDTSVNGVE